MRWRSSDAGVSLRQLRPDLAGEIDCGVVGIGAEQLQDRDLHGIRAAAGRELDHAVGEDLHAVRARRAGLGEAVVRRRKGAVRRGTGIAATRRLHFLINRWRQA